MSDLREVAVFGSSQTTHGSPAWEEAEMVGRELAEAGFGVITGGYGGTMEAVCKGARSVGGHTLGVTAPALFPGRIGANPYVTEIIETSTLNQRIGVMMERASGAVALAGSIGTATELLVAWNHNHIARRNGGRSIPTVAVGRIWSEIARTMVEEARAQPADIQLEPTAPAALTWLMQQLKNH